MGFRLTFVATLLLFNSLVVAPQAPAAPERVPVVVELFTSEGCSSCPPADALLLELDKQSIPGVQIIALGQHVDYWNHLGWADRFSSAKFSQRQSAYSVRFGLDSVYTPQIVVDGRTQFVGNDRGSVRRAIENAAKQPLPAQIKLAHTADGIGIAIAAPGMDEARGLPQVMLAITEDGLTTSVERGENGGRTLQHAAVVRDLRKIGEVKDGKFSTSRAIEPRSEWHKENVQVVVFLQIPGTMQIVGAASTNLN